MPDSTPLLPSSLHTMEVNKDEVDEGHHVDGKNWRASKDTGNDRDKDNNSNGGDDVIVHDDEAEKDDVIEILDRFIRENHPEDCIVVDWLKGECCIVCKSKDGQVLFCNENNCPLAFHEVCMTWKPKLDDMGKFYCPYCLYKQEMVRFKELRTKFMLAEEGLSNFIRLARDGGSKEKKMEGAPVSTMVGEVSTGDCENEQNDDGKEKCDEGSTFGADGFDNDGKGERVVEDMKNSSGSKDDASNEDQRQIRSSSSSHVGIVEDTLHVSRKVTSDIVGLVEENQGLKDEEEPKLQNPVGTSLPSKVPAVESCEFLSPGLVTENLVAGEKLDKQTDESSTAMNMNMNPLGTSLPSKVPSVESCEFLSPGLVTENLVAGEKLDEPTDESSTAMNMNMNPLGTSLPSKVPAVESCEFLSPGLVTENLVAGEKLDEQTAESSSEMNMNMNPVGISLPSKVPAVESCQFLSPGLVTENLVAGEKLDEQTAESSSEMNMNMNPVGISLPSKVPAVESCQFLSPGLVTENLVAGKKLDEQTDESSGAMNMNQEGNRSTTKISVECRKSATPFMNPIVMDAGKRKRLKWTAEEEEMLKELVPSFASKVNKNIPWRKILDQGHSVFHSTRTPADLKDKWKKIAPKESEKDDEGN